jgi:allantoinase
VWVRRLCPIPPLTNWAISIAKNLALGSAIEVEKLWRRLAAGDVDLVSTDHVSWSLDRKTNPDMLANAFGLPGLETMAPLFAKGALDRGVSLTWMAKLMAENPAKHFRLDHVRGALTPGRDADIMVLTPDSYVVDTAKSGNSVGGWSPFDGMVLPYKVAATYVRGRPAYDGAKVLAEPCSGRFVRPPERILIADKAA